MSSQFPFIYRDIAGSGSGKAGEMQTIIGKTVKGKIDCPVGSHHPSFIDMIYPINYGYVEGVMAEDGEERDVYVLGTDAPLETFEGSAAALDMHSVSCL